MADESKDLPEVPDWIKHVVTALIDYAPGSPISRFRTPLGAVVVVARGPITTPILDRWVDEVGHQANLERVITHEG